MSNVRKRIESVLLFLEGKSRPQTVRSIPKKLVYRYLILHHNSIRELYNEQDRRSGTNTSDDIYLKCVPICEVPVSECPCNLIPGCTWFRTKYPLPEFSGSKLNHVYLSINGGRQEIGFTELRKIESQSKSFRSFRSQLDRYTLIKETDGTYAYFSFPEKLMPEFVSMAHRWTNPLELLRYSTCDEGKEICDFLGSNFDIDARYEIRVIEATANSLRNMMLLLGNDDIIGDNVDGTLNPNLQNV